MKSDEELAEMSIADRNAYLDDWYANIHDYYEDERRITAYELELA